MDSNDTVVDDIDPQCSALMISAINAGNWTEEKPLRRLLESEDSSYDSDYENNDSEQQSSVVPNTPRRFSGHHDEVSRTTSETLGQEFEEYLTSNISLPQPTFLDVIISDPNYIKSVEFALKLGYTESQVQIALMKLGPTAGQNELLAELIKLGAGTGNNISIYSGLGKTLVSSLINETCGEEGLFGDNNDSQRNLRPIVIDGSNVAISHGNKECFSCLGIKICVEWFQARGHREITVFVPMWRKEVARPDAPIKDQEILSQLESERLLVFTPSRNVGGRRMVCYDDRYILKLAAQNDGIVVSNDNYRDLANENSEYKKVVEERLLMYSFVNDRFMPPDDPLGRKGPSLNNFLRKRPQPPDVLPPPCPYGKKCTYGNKCKYYHPERGNQPHKSVTERLAEQAKIQIEEVKNRNKGSRESSPGDSKLKVTHSLPLQMGCDINRKKLPLSRTQSVKPSKSLPLEDEHSFNQPFVRHVFSDKSHTCDHNKSSENLHRKLQRQLTLNPNFDPRLQALKHGFEPQNKRDVHQNCSPLGTKPTHRQLTRLGSDGPTLAHLQKQNQIQHQNLLYVPHSQYLSAQSQDSLHTLVTRNCSAPDSSSNWPPSYSPSMARLNSTSDTRLNLTPPPAPFPNQIWSTNSGSLIVPPNPNPWNQSDNSSTLRNSHNALSAPVRPSSVPLNELKQTLVQPTPVRPMRAVSPNLLNDSRSKLYFHLSQIFPEEQVRTAMDLYPDETNPQSICAVILTMFPKKC